MKKILIALVFLFAVSCSTGLDKQMADLLDRVEDEMGYVNTISVDDMVKMAGWYQRHGDDGQNSRALFCLGRALFNDKSYSAAIVAYTKALELAEKSGDVLHEGLISQDIARTCGISGNSSDEMLYLARAAEAFKKAGVPDKSQAALLEIGRVKASLGSYVDAEEIFKSVLYDVHDMKDTLLEARCLEAYASLAVSKDEPDPALAIDMLGRASGELHYPLNCSDKGILAYSYSLAGHGSEADKWLSEARAGVETEADAADIDFREYQIASRSGDKARALKALERVTEYGNKSQAAALQEAVSSSQREYIQGQSDIREEKLKAASLRLWLFALAALLVIGALGVAYVYYSSVQRRRLEEEITERDKYMSIAEELSRRLTVGPFDSAQGPDNADGERSRTTALPHGPGFEALERLCEQYYIHEGTANLQPKIFKEVKSIVEGLRSDRKTQKTLEDMLDESKDGVMTKLRSEFPAWKEDDYLLYSFTAAGFSSTTISALMEKEKNVIYNRVWRLKGRISNSGSPLKEFFIDCLGR